MRGFNPDSNNNKSNQGNKPNTLLIGGDKGILAHELMVGLMGAVPTFGNTKITVGFHGDQAFCSQKFKYVNLPQLPPTKVLPTKIAQEIRGFAAHEAAHLIWTDENVFNMMTEEEKTGLVKELWNAIEDYMIERNWLTIYPGSHKNFTSTEARCCTQYLASYNKNPDMAKDLRIIGPVALTWVRAIHFNLKTPLTQDCIDTLPTDFKRRIWEWFDEMLDIETTEESLELARKIEQEIQAEPFDPNDPPTNMMNPNQNNQCQGQGQQGQGSGQGSGSGNGSSGQGSAGGSMQQGNGSGQNLNGPQPEPYSIKHSLDDALKESGIENQEHQMLSYKIPSSVKEGPMSEILANPDGIHKSEHVLSNPEVSSTIGSVSRTFRRALQSLAKDRWKGGRADGQIDDKRLAGVLLGNTEIYKKKVKAPRIDTAVTILVDCSGSMNGTRLEICQQLALIMKASFMNTPIKFEIVGFTSGDESSLPDNIQTMAKAIREETEDYANIRAVSLYDFKSFDSTHHASLTTIGNMLDCHQGGTPTGDAILMAHERLSKRKERRHVMFVLTDGEPDDYHTCKEAVNSVEACNTTVLGIGIGSTSVKRSFKNHIVLNTPNDLTAVIMSQMADMLLKDKNKVGLIQQHKPTHIR